MMFKLFLLFVLYQLIDGVPIEKPTLQQTIRNARNVVHSIDWVSIATTSTMPSIQGYPFAGVKSTSDGVKGNSTGIPYLYMTEWEATAKDLAGDCVKGNSTGIPYLYMTDWEATAKDLAVDRRCSLLATLASTDYCREKNYDPQDHTCTRVFITGNFTKVPKSSPEYNFGLEALYSKHPVMKSWPEDHGFFVAKVDIVQIGVMDHFGATTYLDINDYFSAEVSSYINSAD